MLLNSKFHFTSYQVKMKCIASPAILDQVLIGNASAAQTQIFKNLMQLNEMKQCFQKTKRIKKSIVQVIVGILFKPTYDQAN